MESRSAEIASEQKYFDIAAEQREHRIRDLAAIPGAAAHPGAAKHLKKYAADAARAMGSGDAAVAFGRIDLDDEDEDTLYIGKHLIRHDNAARHQLAHARCGALLRGKPQRALGRDSEAHIRVRRQHDH